MRLHAHRCSGTFSLVLTVYCSSSAFAAENPATLTELPAVEVIGTTPLPGIGIPIERVPGNVQRATNTDIKHRQSLDITEFLGDAMDSVHVNGAQNNPFQPDVNFRGFAASPLLGTPQGLSVFIDGVRVNESFGDVVNWDLIPRSAISSIHLIPGSNPVFGLNTLGGALSIQTKSGFQHPGFASRLTGGQFGRRALEVEYGGHGEHVDYFVTANRFSENGWRDHSPSDVSQMFAKVGFQDARTDFDISLSLADNRLEGTQSLPLSMLGNPRQAYTWPDRTQNQLTFLNARGSRFLSDNLLVSGGTYYRALDSEGFFSNVNDDFDPLSPAGPGNTPAHNTLNNTVQRTYGFGMQFTYTGKIANRENQFNIGVTADRGTTEFTSRGQEGDFVGDRGATGTSPFSLETAVHTRNRYYGVYVSNMLALTDKLHVTLSGRHNSARIDIEDRSGVTPALNGNHRYNRFNPAAGFTYAPLPALTLYTNYSEGMRAPTPVELTCADPAAPCRLPNAFLADPPLRPVLAKTWEAGLRGTLNGVLSGTLKWRAAVYRTQLQDDILFVNSSATVDSGFFQNTGRTWRQGLELGGEYRANALRVMASYSYIDATFRSPFTLASPNNSSAVDTDGDGHPDTIQVNAGNRIPGIPQHLFKLRVEYEPVKALLFGAGMQSAAAQYARGDENNQDAQGKIPGYTIFNVDARYAVDRNWSLLAKINNITNRGYQTFGVLGTNFFRGAGGTFDALAATPEQFRSSGAPRAAWIGLEYRFDPPKSKNN